MASTTADAVTGPSRARSDSLDAGTLAPSEKRLKTSDSSPVPQVEPSQEVETSVEMLMLAGPIDATRADDVGGPTPTPLPAASSPSKHPSGVPACLRLPDDLLFLIVGQLVTPHYCEPYDYRGGVALPPNQPVADLKRLALVHSIFLDPVRTLLYGTPNLEGSMGDLKDPCACQSCQVGRSAHWQHSPLRRLAEALTLNPALGSYIRHCDRLGDLTQSLSHFNISPSLVSRTILGVLSKAPNVLSLDMPLVELRDQGDLVEAVTRMKSLRRLKLSSGCGMTKDGTSMIHEGDLRRIARACTELEELEILTEHLGCGASDGWVEPFPFNELREVRVVRATSLTDKHLLAMLSSAKHLEALTVIKSAGLDGTSGVVVPGTTKRSHSLTTTGIAAIISRRGATLKHLHIDVSDQEPPTDTASGTIPSIQAALVSCPRLRTLTLCGPSLILPSSLPHLGSIGPTKPSRYFGMPFPGPGAAPVLDLPGLSNLERLSIGLYPPTFPPLLDFLRSLPPTHASPFTQLKSITITNPPPSCTGHDLDAAANVAALQAAVGDKSISLIFTTPSYEWDATHAWARPGNQAPRAPGAGFPLLGGPVWAQGPPGWAAGAPGGGNLARRFNGAARAGVLGVGPALGANPAAPFVRMRRIGGPANDSDAQDPMMDGGDDDTDYDGDLIVDEDEDDAAHEATGRQLITNAGNAAASGSGPAAAPESPRASDAGPNVSLPQARWDSLSLDSDEDDGMDLDFLTRRGGA
ncbi:hypothetical protein RQP46_010986 [Phenoliferia psychrophenolica]